MQQRKIVEDYLDSVIPQKISESTKKRLRAEIESHIYDRADFYMEIGYDEDAAFEKAIEQMGEGEEVKTEFESLYNDSTSKAVLLLVSSLLVDLSAVILGFGGAAAWSFVLGYIMHLTFESLLVSACFVCFTCFTIHYAYMRNKPKKLKAIGFANMIMSLLTVFANSVYWPFAFLLTEAFNDLFVGEEGHYFSSAMFSYLSLIISVPVCIFSFALYFKLKKGKAESRCRKISFRKLLGIYVVVFAVVCAAGWYICNTPGSEYFNYSGLGYIIGEELLEPLKSDQTDRLFESITGDTDFTRADELLRGEGFIPHTEMDKHLTDEEKLNNLADELQNYISKREGEIVYTKPIAEPGGDYISYFNECIILYPSESGKLKYKKIIEAYDYYTKKDDADKAVELFEALKLGEDKKAVLKKMKKVSDFSSLSVEYGESIKETYSFRVVEDLSFLSLVDCRSLGATVTFENGLLQDGSYIYTVESNFETDDVVCDETEYFISE